MRVDTRGVENNTNTSRGLTLDFCNLCTNGSGVLMASASKFDVVHASDYDGRLFEKTREEIVWRVLSLQIASEYEINSKRSN
jgi:hypothetical protein